MKKFYSLALAVAVAAGSLTVSAQELTSKRALPLNSEAKTVTTTEKVTASLLKEKGTLSNRADRNIAGTYFLSCVAGTDLIMDAFTIEQGSQPNSYVVKNLFWGADAQPLNAQYVSGTYNDVFYEFLIIPTGQYWFSNQGQKCIIRAGVKNASSWGTVTDPDTSNDIDLEFMLEEIDGDLTWYPSWEVQGYSSGLAWVFEDNQNRGNCFPDTEFYPANGTFAAKFGTQQATAVNLDAPAYAYSYRQAGKDILEIAGVCTDQYTLNPITLAVDDNGEATGTNLETGLQFTLEDQSTAVGYYWSGGEETTPTVHANVTFENGKTIVKFVGNALAVGINMDGEMAPARIWWDPVITIDRTFNIAGVENIAADAEFDQNAPVEYFNLQGIRVAQPEEGQLLIKRQGNKATKVVIR